MRLVDPFGQVRRDGVPLTVHAVGARVVVADRPERVQAHVQDQGRKTDPAGRESLQQARRKVQAGRRRGGRTVGIGEDRLVALGVADPAADVGR